MFSLILLSLLNTASAQDAYDAHGFRLVPSDGELNDPLTVMKSEAMSEGTFSSEVLWEYAYQPLTLHYSDGTESSLVEDLSVFNFGFGYDLSEVVGLRVSVPLVAYDDGFVFGLGDSRVSAPVLLYAVDHGISISAVPYFDIPSPDPIQYLSSAKTDGGGFLAGTYSFSRVSFSANAGLDLSPKMDFYNLVGGPSVPLGLAVSYRLGDTLALRGEGQYDLGLKKNLEPGKGTPGEVTASLRSHKKHFSWTIGAATALNESASVATFRGFLGIGTSLGKKPVQTQRMEITINLKYPEVLACDCQQLVPVYFEFDKDLIRDQDVAYLEKAASFLVEHSEITLLKVSAGADERGSLVYNQDLAMRRAHRVGQFFIDHGVAADRLTYDSLGEEHPQHEVCIDEECFLTNRYAEFTIISVKE